MNDSSPKIEEAVQNLFVENRWSLSTAESCTGGAIAARLTRNPGASDYFLGGLVTYSNRLKEQMLHVDRETLASEGAVSEKTVKEMAVGAIQITDSDFSLAVSGIAGPSGGSEDKPIGTVWIAVAKKGCSPLCRKIQGYGNREMIIEQSVNAALGMLLQYASSGR